MKNHSRIHIIRMRSLVIAAVTAALAIAAALCIYTGLNIIRVGYDSAKFSESAKSLIIHTGDGTVCTATA